MAAVLAGGEGAVLSHLSAAARWRILENRAKPEVTVPRMRRSRPDLRFRVATLLPDEVTTVDGIPITTVPRTLLDLAAVVDAHRLERAFNEAEYRRLDDALSVADLLERHPSRRGSASLRALLEEVAHDQGITRHELEHRFLAFVDETGLLRPRRNAAIEIEPGRWIEGDCVWPEACLIVELDSRAAHGTRSRFESDRERDRLLAVAGWTVVRVTWRQLHRHPRGLAADLRALLTRRYRAET